MSIYSIGVSGVQTAQIALKTTSNNITNVYTPGYNRELTLLEETHLGGVRVTDVQRQFDYFVASQLNSATSTLSGLQSYNTNISQIDNLLANNDAGLAPLMQNFFSAIQDLAVTPSDSAAREGVIGTADTLSSQIRAVDSYLQNIQEDLNTQISSEIGQINNSAELIAQLNRDIALAASQTGEAPNSLLNQRDQAVAELSERIEVRLLIQDGGYYNLSIGNGQPLVAGTEAFSLEGIASSIDPSQTVAGYKDSAGNTVELSEGFFDNGRIGGLFEFRSESLNKVQNLIGQIAVSLASGFNAQHQLGLDLNGDPGGDFFAIGDPGIFSNNNNTGTASMTAAYGNVVELTGTDYNLKVSDASTNEFTITPMNGGDSFTMTLDGSNQLSFDGLVLSVGTPAALVDGDQFQLQPTRRAAGSFENLIQSTDKIAAGLAFGSGDNRNALAMQDLQLSKLVGGSASLSQAYSSLVGFVGNQTNIVQVNMAAQEGLTEQIRTMQQSVAGVNLDEEAANLVRYQQYYQASAKVIEVGGTLLDTILGLRA